MNHLRFNSQLLYFQKNEINISLNLFEDRTDTAHCTAKSDKLDTNMENSDIDLYDDIFVQNKENNYDESDLDDLYGNIHNPEAAETAVQKLMTLTKDHEKLQSQFGTLKSQVSILKNLNTELSTKNKNLEKNFKELIETARTEINRKNDQIKNLRSELDNILFKRAARNINARELEALWEKHKIPEEPFAKLPTQARLKQQQMVGSPDVNVANRQFVAKKRKIEADPSPSHGKENPTKKLKTCDELVVKKSAPLSNVKDRVINTDMSDISKYVKERKKKERFVVEDTPVSQESIKKVDSKVSGQEETKDLKKVEPVKRVEEQIKRVQAPNKKPIKGAELSETTQETEEKAETRDDGHEGRVTRARGSSGGRHQLRNKSGITSSSSSCRKPDPSPSSEKKTEDKVINLMPKPNVEVSKDTKHDRIQKNKKTTEEEGQEEEDILEIGNTETFDDLDFEPYDTEAGGSVTFKSLSTNFSIPKKSNDIKKMEKFTVLKKDGKGILKQCNSTKTEKSEKPVVNYKTDVKGSVSTRRRSRSKGRNEEKKPRSRERVRRKSGSSERDRRKSVERSRRKSGSGERDRRKSAERVRRKSGSGERDRERRRSRERGRRRSRSRSRNRRAERSPFRRKRSSSRDKLRKERRRSGSRKRAGSPSSGKKGKEVNRKLTRKSQSLSPARLNYGEDNLNLHDIDIEDDMSLDALEKIKSQIRDKMGLDDNLEPVRGDDETEDGEVSDSDAEEKEAKIVDLRKKLKNKFPKEDNITSSSTTSTER